MHRSAMLCKYAPAIHSASARRRVFRCRARAKWRLRELQMSCVLRICLLHPPSADRGVPLKARYAPRTTHTHSGSSEKWWPTGVTPHALRLRLMHSHAQGVGEGLRTTSSGPARGPQRVSMRGGDGVPWPAAGADFLEFFSFFAIFYLFSWEFGVLAAMLSRLATACRRC